MPVQFTKNIDWAAVVRRVWDYKYFGRDPTPTGNNTLCLNIGTFPGEYGNGMNAAGTGVVDMFGVDGNNNVVFPTSSYFPAGISSISGQFQNPPMLKTVTYNDTLNASIGTTPFFIADQAYTITAITYVNKTAGTVAGATATVTHDTGTLAPGAGTSLQTTAFSCLSTANTVQTATLTATTAALTLAAGDRLAVLFAGTLTTLAGVVITVTMMPTQPTASTAASETAQIFWRVNGDIATQTVFQANRDMVVTGVKAIYGTAFGAAITIDVTKDTGTTAAGGGTSVLTAAMAGDGTINTVLSPALTATASVLSMVAGDRIAVKFSATTTGALFCLLVTFQPIYNRKEVIWQLAPNAQQQVAQCFFIADRPYEIVDASCIFDVAAGGAAKLAVTIDKGTTVPGNGNVVQTDNTNAGFDMNAAARTTQFMTPASLHLRLLSPGDRLGLKVTGAAQSIADVNITCSLRPNY